MRICLFVCLVWSCGNLIKRCKSCSAFSLSDDFVLMGSIEGNWEEGGGGG